MNPAKPVGACETRGAEAKEMASLPRSTRDPPAVTRTTPEVSEGRSTLTVVICLAST